MADPSVADLRKNYQLGSLDQVDACDDPIDQFAQWWQAVLSSGIAEPNGMTLATVGEDGRPSARIVLLKGFDQGGFYFFTNYNSRKGQELGQNSHAAIVFWWEPLERQVRIEGTVAQLPAAESDAYFNSRPKGSRIGAWASPQSTVIGDRQLLEDNQTRLETEYANTEDIPRPPHWGGFCLSPTRVEFWQGRPSRLHDRICYDKTEDGWDIVRLAP